MTDLSGIPALEQGLNSFDPAERRAAVAELARLAETGEIAIPPERPVANLHAHTFFSFNAYGYSPSAIAWLAKKQGYRLIGIVDFDVLDGVSEFLDACEALGVRGSAGMETRIFLPEFATREINSPGEPGVDYHMGIGFTSSQVPQEVAPVLADQRERALRRNQIVIQRLNDFLSPVRVDYQADVASLTPSGNPTERHMVQAYIAAAARSQADPAAFWAKKLGMPASEMIGLIADSPRFQNLLRAKLMKQGGPGYVVPTAETFPGVDEVHRLVRACGAIPCVAWLDGTSQGEQDIVELLELLIGKGAGALNIVPDRNWNIADPAVRSQKVAKLYEIVRIAGELDLPLNVGTEMNSFGQRLVDDFSAAELSPVRQAFLDGAHFVYGHTLMQRALGLGWGTSWAVAHFPGRKERNAFYTQVGQRVPPGRESIRKLQDAGSAAEPDEIMAAFVGAQSGAPSA